MSLVLFRNGKLFDGLAAETRDGMEVLVEDDRIKAISDTRISATDARVVDLGGRTLMPGLIDAHFHAVAADPNIGHVRQAHRRDRAGAGRDRARTAPLYTRSHGFHPGDSPRRGATYPDRRRHAAVDGHSVGLCIQPALPQGFRVLSGRAPGAHGRRRYPGGLLVVRRSAGTGRRRTLREAP